MHHLSTHLYALSYLMHKNCFLGEKRQHTVIYLTSSSSFSGVDDLNMCELSVEETGLTKKKGAEILGREFESEWSKSGGTDYMKKNANKITSKFLQRRLNLVKWWWFINRQLKNSATIYIFGKQKSFQASFLVVVCFFFSWYWEDKFYLCCIVVDGIDLCVLYCITTEIRITQIALSQNFPILKKSLMIKYQPLANIKMAVRRIHHTCIKMFLLAVFSLLLQMLVSERLFSSKKQRRKLLIGFDKSANHIWI